MSNAEGFVDIIEKGALLPCKQLPIDSMQCSIRVDQYLLIGSSNKLYLIDLKKDFTILTHIALSRHIFSICFMNSHNVVCGQQGGQMAMVELINGNMNIVCENKVASAIYKVIRTNFDDYALACSGGLFFAQYDARRK